MSEKCPKCGAERDSHDRTGMDFLCGTTQFSDQSISEGKDCLRRQLAQRGRCGNCGRPLTLNESGQPLPCEQCEKFAAQSICEDYEPRLAALKADKKRLQELLPQHADYDELNHCACAFDDDGVERSRCSYHERLIREAAQAAKEAKKP